MSSFLDSQKTQSIVGLANLAQTQQVNKNVKALKASQEEENRLREKQNQIASNISVIHNKQLKAQGNTNELLKLDIQLQEAERTRVRIRDEKKDRLEKEIMEKKDVLFQVRLDTKSISQSTKIHAIEKFYTLNAIAVTLRELNINRQTMVAIEDKQYLEDTFQELNSLIESIYESFSEEEIEDTKTINKILAVDEESLIDEKEDQLKQLGSYKKYIKERIKIIGGLEKKVEQVKHLKLNPFSTGLEPIIQRVINITKTTKKPSPYQLKKLLR